jgi:hypothetical protein
MMEDPVHVSECRVLAPGIAYVGIELMQLSLHTPLVIFTRRAHGIVLHVSCPASVIGDSNPTQYTN